ncbi:MAG: hypothetical protein H0T46_35705 [Deltaproteobacteria bacterium]|nr:hypothetical protein [Deltaproteobacteria bacterium]
MTRAIFILALVLSACGGEHREARVTYNEGVTALAAGDLETAEAKLLAARSAAGVDPELRFRAAYDLGVAYALHADKLRNDKEPDLAKALELAQQSASWFSDALRLRTDDANTIANLAIVRARVQSISDELRKGEGKLEARLDRLIGEQRSVLDDARGAWLAIKQAGGTDPLAHQGTLTHLADRERGIVAEAGVISDLASEEIDAIGKKSGDKRSDEEKVRVVQLKNVDLYLLDSRARIADARRKLQELAAEEGVAKAEAALIALKRAREQLLDPITVLQGVARDELEVLQDSMRSNAMRGSVTIELGKDPVEPAGPVPSWLQPPAIGERQANLRDRLEEVRARLAAAVETPPDPKQPVDPKQAKVLDRVRIALPFVIEASGAMDRAASSLREQNTAPAIEHQRTALVALGNAIEQFSDLKQTIELAYQTQHQVAGLLSPEGEKVPAEERGRATKEGIASNRTRVERLKGLIADELAAVDEKAPKEAPKDPKETEAQQQQLAQAKEQLNQAEQLRAQAAAKLAELDKAIASAGAPLPPAKEAEAKLEELRRLFFSVIEHLQQLIRDQGDTRDQTSAANGDDTFSREPKFPTLIGRQEGHGQMAKAITDALAAQADAASKQQGPSKPGAPDPKTLSAAADEVRQAQSEMGDAGRYLVKARDNKQASMSLEPAMKSEAKAIEHLEAALRLLQPPQDKKQDKQDQQKQDQQKQDQQQQKGGASQRARDEDARRQKERRKQDGANDPVEKDW